ncbi:hypothetical protein [Shewanella surugensis]|uniref:Uncharacterized protein n=1 Tax=Shewanella surugensis TaxID=212020 RepID=A0ABT0LFZ5_9GAMM|nr:hypothetical protein [Shewanella surugensis]MCL1126618.1 hypothetical protein [Shewanella surugensis]
MLNNLNQPIVIVGGQSVSYWLDFYSASLNGAKAQTASVDIDFVANRNSVKQITKVWNIDVKFAGIDVPPPSVAIAQLIDRDSNKIKMSRGLQFIDVDMYENEGYKKANLVDFIDFPSGFTRKEFLGKSKTIITAQYEFSIKSGLKSHENLLILNPFGCLISRVSNIFNTPKDNEIA